MKQQRPVHLDLATIKFPPMAIASILHRISGVLLFLLLPIMLYFLNQSLHAEASFEHFTHQTMGCGLCKLTIWLFLAAWVYHLLAGIRHLVMDMGFGETVDISRLSAWIVIGASVLVTLVIGVGLWS